jgi:hypothetical protein
MTIRYEVDLWVSGKNRDDQGMPSTNLTDDYDLCWCKDCRFAWYSKTGKNFSEVPEWFKPVLSFTEFSENPDLFALMFRAIEPG